MFTWICPKCKREVPPAYSECPDCARAAAEQPAAEELPAAEAPVEQPAAPAPVVTRPRPPVQQAPPAYAAPPAAAPPVMYAPSPSRGLPTWLLTILFTFAFVGVGAGVYWVVGYARGPQPSTTVESPAAKPGAPRHPLQKHIEVTGVRFIENAKKQAEVRFLVINHSAAEIDGLAANVTLWARTQKSEEDATGTFTFATNLAPWESKELTARLTSKLKIYELPDWQNLSTDLQITAPVAASGGSGAPR